MAEPYKAGSTNCNNLAEIMYPKPALPSSWSDDFQ